MEKKYFNNFSLYMYINFSLKCLFPLNFRFSVATSQVIPTQNEKLTVSLKNKSNKLLIHLFHIILVFLPQKIL